jgi:hypothetical protein
MKIPDPDRATNPATVRTAVLDVLYQGMRGFHVGHAEWRGYLNDAELASTLGVIASACVDRLAAAGMLSVSPLPARREWRADLADAGDADQDSSDYVDGWNDALDAVEATRSTATEAESKDLRP